MEAHTIFFTYCSCQYHFKGLNVFHVTSGDLRSKAKAALKLSAGSRHFKRDRLVVKFLFRIPKYLASLSSQRLYEIFICKAKICQ